MLLDNGEEMPPFVDWTLTPLLLNEKVQVGLGGVAAVVAAVVVAAAVDVVPLNSVPQKLMANIQNTTLVNKVQFQS